MKLPGGIRRRVIRTRLLAFGGLALLALPVEALAESKSRFEAQDSHIPAAAIEVIDLAGERAAGPPPQAIGEPTGRTDLSVILWDELKRSRGPGSSGGAQSSVGNQASMVNGQTLR